MVNPLAVWSPRYACAFTQKKSYLDEWILFFFNIYLLHPLISASKPLLVQVATFVHNRLFFDSKYKFTNTNNKIWEPSPSFSMSEIRV